MRTSSPIRRGALVVLLSVAASCGAADDATSDAPLADAPASTGPATTTDAVGSELAGYAFDVVRDPG